MMLPVFALYLGLVFLVGVVATLFSSKSEEGYFLSDRDLGPIATAISAGASESSGWIFIGAAGLAYSVGVASMWMLPGFAAGAAIQYLLIAPRLRRHTAAANSISIPDYLEDRFTDSTGTIRVVASVTILAFAGTYVAAQLTAAAVAFNVVLDTPYTTGILLAFVFTTVYTLIGGFKGVVWTDVVQGLIMLLVLVIFPAYLILYLGGVGAAIDQIGQASPRLLSVTGGQTGSAVFGFVVGFLSQGLAAPGQPHVVQRFMGSESDQTIEQATVIGMIWVVIVMTGSNLLGLLGRVLLSDLANPEYVFPELVMEFMPGIIAGIVLAAIFAAVMSSADSLLILTSQTISHDIYKQLLAEDISQKRAVWIGRGTVLTVGTIAAVAALQDLRVVFWFVLYAYAGLGASFGPALLLSLHWDGMTRWGAVAGITGGALTTIIWENIPSLASLIYEGVPAILVSTLLIVVISLMTTPSHDTQAQPQQG